MRARLSPRDYATDQGGGKRRGIRSHADVSALLPMCFPTRFSGKQIRLKSLISLAHPDTRPHNPQKRTFVATPIMSALRILAGKLLLWRRRLTGAINRSGGNKNIRSGFAGRWRKGGQATERDSRLLSTPGVFHLSALFSDARGYFAFELIRQVPPVSPAG